MPPFLISFLVQIGIQFVMKLLVPQGLKAAEQALEPHKDNLKQAIKEHLPKEWKDMPVDGVIDSILPIVFDLIKDKVADNIPLAEADVPELSAHVLAVAYAENLNSSNIA